MGRMEPGQSPVVQRASRQRMLTKASTTGLTSGLIHLFLALAIYLEISWGSLINFLNWSHPIILYAEYGLAAYFTLFCLLDFMKYLGITFSTVTVEITPQEKTLLGVRDNEPGFRVVNPKPVSDSGPGLIISQSSFTGPSSPLSSPYSPGSPFRPLGRITPPSYSHSGIYSRTPSPSSRTPSPLQLSGGYTGTGLLHGGSFVQSSGSFLNASHSYGVSSHNSSQNLSTSFHQSPSAGSPLQATNLSGLFHESLDTSGLRNRSYHNLSATTSPIFSSRLLPDEECMTDQRTLQRYLKEQEEREHSQMVTNDSNTSAGPSFWNYNRSMADHSMSLRKYQYQVACRSPQSTKSRDTDPDDPATYRGVEVWHRLDVYPDELELWTENVRKWLSLTVMNRVARQIRSVNAELVRMGSEELQIGGVSVSTLKQVAVTKSQYIPTLNTLVPYLECSSNQEYLAQRILELGAGGAMSDFCWNGGEYFKGKPWAEHLPTDAAIVMHCLCTYMDSQLPAHPRYPDGKTFTTQHYIRSPDKPDLKKSDNLLIYQAKITPPHFKVIIGDDTWDLQKGRANMFHAILLFFYHILTKEHGMLGRVNLGLSGINVAWVLDRKI